MNPTVAALGRYSLAVLPYLALLRLWSAFVRGGESPQRHMPSPRSTFQGLLSTIRCLDPDESLSPGQLEEIERVCREHADLSDDAFVAEHLERWLG